MRYRASVERAVTSGFHLGGKQQLAVVSFGLSCGSYWKGRLQASPVSFTFDAVNLIGWLDSNETRRKLAFPLENWFFILFCCSTLKIQLLDNSVKLVNEAAMKEPSSEDQSHFSGSCSLIKPVVNGTTLIRIIYEIKMYINDDDDSCINRLISTISSMSLCFCALFSLQTPHLPKLH